MINIKELTKNIKRRSKNNKDKVKFFLEFINNDFIIYDNSIFIKDENIVDTLESLGFIKENFVIFNLSHCTYYWDKYNIEVELVYKKEWEILQTCVEICNLTDYFDLNTICNIINHGKTSTR